MSSDFGVWGGGSWKDFPMNIHTQTHTGTHTKLWIVYTNKLYKLDGDRTVWGLEKKVSWFPKLLR